MASITEIKDLIMIKRIKRPKIFRIIKRIQNKFRGFKYMVQNKLSIFLFSIELINNKNKCYRDLYFWIVLIPKTITVSNELYNKLNDTNLTIYEIERFFYYNDD